MPRDIPGFYYNPEKNKYFRLLTGNRHHDGSFHNHSSTTSPHANASTSSTLKKCHENFKKWVTNSIVKSIASNQLKPDMSLLQVPVDQLMTQRFDQIKQLVHYEIATNRVCHKFIPLPEKNMFVGTWDVNGNSSLMTLTFGNKSRPQFSRCQSVYETMTDIDCVPKSTDGHCLFYCVTPEYRDQRMETKLQVYQLHESDFSSMHRSISMINCCSFDVKENSSCVCAHSNNFCAVGLGGSVQMFQLNQTELVSTHKFFINKANQINDLAFDSKGQTLLCVGTNKPSLAIIDLRDNRSWKRLDNQNDKAMLSFNVQWLPHRTNEFIVAGMDHQLELFDVRLVSRGPLLKFVEHKNSSSRTRFSIDSELDLLACNGDDNQLRVWSTRSGQLIHERPVKSLGLKTQSPDQLQLAMGGVIGMGGKESWLKVWTADNRRVSCFGLVDDKNKF